MARYRASIATDLAPQIAFEFLADFTHVPQWDPGTASAVRLDDGPVRLGSVFRLGVRAGSRVVDLDYEVTAYDSPRRLVLLARSDAIRSEDSVTVTPTASGGSVVTYEADLRLVGRFALADPVLPVLFDRIGDRAAAGLRTALGAPPAPVEHPPAGALVARTVDLALEATVVGSFSSLGPTVRRRTAGWTPPPSLEGRTVLVTGATSGLGLAAAQGLARAGAQVVVTGRSVERAEDAAGTVRAAAPGSAVSFLSGDLGEFDQVRSLAEEFLSAHDRLDVLIHNAGALASTYATNATGTEVTVASQVAGPYLLTGLLSDVLGAGAPSRVVQVSSGGMYTQRFDLATMESTPEEFDGTVAYAKAKRAQLVLMHEWVRRMRGSGVSFHAMHPGWVDTPGLHTSLPRFARLMGPLLRSPEQGADTAVWLAAAPAGAEQTGRFWLDRQARLEHKVPWTHLSDEEFVEAGAALWAWCAERTGWDGRRRSTG